MADTVEYVEHPGEYGPYRLYHNGDLIDVPKERVVRDYSYGYSVDDDKLFEQALVDGHCGALLAERPMKTRAIVIIKTGSDEEPKYSWACRMQPTDEAQLKLPEWMREVLLPVPLARATFAHERWSADATLASSRLVTHYKPTAIDYEAL